MKPCITCLALTALLAGSCHTMRPFDAEADLVPKTGETWMMVGNYLEIRGDSLLRHEHVLFSLQEYSGTTFGQSFYNAHTTSGISRLLGGASYDSLFTGRKDRFPIKVSMTTRSALEEGEIPFSGFTMGRKRFIWETSGPNQTGRLHRSYAMCQESYLPVLPVSEDRSILICAPDMDRTSSGDSAYLSIAVFRNRQDLVSLADNGSVLWLDIRFLDGTQDVALIHVDTVGNCKMLASHGFENLPGAVKTVGPYWTSPATGISYPLEYVLSGVKSQALHIFPTENLQEITVQGNGLWLGAVMAKDSSGKLFGYGGMTLLQF